MVGMDNDGGNILCAQGLLLDQTTTTLVFWLCVALAPFLGAVTLKRVSSICMDDCGEVWAAVAVARQRGFFNMGKTIFPCAFHKITLPLKKSANLSAAGPPNAATYQMIHDALCDLVTYYEMDAEVEAGLACLRRFCGRVLNAEALTRFEAYLKLGCVVSPCPALQHHDAPADVKSCGGRKFDCRRS
jgi:hypothetical protein